MASGAPPASRTGDPAVFLDRDGTLIEDRHYLANPDEIVLRPGAADAVAALNAGGMKVVVVTNQSGIARGFLTEEQFAAATARLGRLLGAAGARIDATYHCPHLPEISGPCDCRKPGTLLFERAIADLGLDPGASTGVGDRWRDIVPVITLGGRGMLVPSPDTPAEDLARASQEASVAETLTEAVTRILRRRSERTSTRG